MRKGCDEFARKISFLAIELRTPDARTIADDDAMRERLNRGGWHTDWIASE
jgi:hypothetical protein